MTKMPLQLPDYPVKTAFSSFETVLRESRAIALEAPTGSGKTSLLPILILNAGLSSKRILLTQPRRLAAKSVAMRISQLLGSPLGQLAGYRIRGESRVSSSTRIEVVTEGYALAMLQADPFLSDYDWLILDEFHERHIEGDILLACLRDLRNSIGKTEAPGMVVMTATWQGQGRSSIAEFRFHKVEGRLFPVKKLYYDGSPGNELKQRLKWGVRQAIDETEGKILVFLPGRREIEDGLRTLTEIYKTAEISLLYGGMELDNQMKVLGYRGPKRQIILATAIAETSLTIEGVTAVVDSGLERLPVYQSSHGLSRLFTRRLSRATADQRAGRAGRLGPGIDYCLWTETEDRELVARWDPGIITGDLSSARLQTAVWGSDNLPWVTPPPEGPWAQAGDLLKSLGAFDANGKITDRGKLLSSLPLPPRIGHMVIESPDLDTAALTAAVLSGGSRFKLDNLSLSDRLKAVRSDKKFTPLLRDANEIHRIIQKAGDSPERRNQIISFGGLLSLAFPDRLGRKAGSGRYELATGASLLCRDCGSDWAIFPEITGPPERLIGRLFEDISLDEIKTFHPQMFSIQRDVTYLPDSGRFRVLRAETLGKLRLKELPSDAPSRTERLIAVENAVKKRGIEALRLSSRARFLLNRLKTAEEIGIKSLPSGDLRQLADSLADWLSPWLQGDLSPKILDEALEARLSWADKNRLDEIFPRQIELRPGQKKMIEYTQPGQPAIRGRLQEFYGLTRPLTIAEGKLTLSVELLSPAMRPLQITSDLGAFWSGSYQQIRSEMRGRYPKHFWPEDPASSPPSLATGKRRPE